MGELSAFFIQIPLSELSPLQMMGNSSQEKNQELEVHMTWEKGHLRQQVNGLHRGQPGSQQGNGDRDKSSSIPGKLQKEKGKLPKRFVLGWSPALSPQEK